MYKDGNAGNLSQSDLSNFVDAYLQMGRRLRENKVEGALTFSTKRAQVEAEILSRYRVLLQTNGQLYFFWKKFHAAARQSAEISGF